MDPAHRAVRVVVHGRVQGVYFRASTQQAAASRGVVGWVRNRPDGTVEAHFEGVAAEVEAMIAWCWRGSPMAQVLEVEVDNVAAHGPETFTILR